MHNHLSILGLFFAMEAIKSRSRILSVNPQNNLHRSLRFIFVIAQIFGFFPIQGVFEKEVTRLGFTWFSIRVVSSVLTLLTGIIVAAGHVRHIAVIDGYQQPQMNAIIFYSSGTLSCIFFIKLAKEWREVMSKWHVLDKAMSLYGWPRDLDRTLKRISIIFLSLEAAEHFSIQANKLIVAVQCRGSFSKGFEHYAVNMSFSMIFDTISYVPLVAIILQCMNTRMAFSWTFIDLMIILMSCALTARFAQVNDRIKYLSDMKVKHLKRWRSVNEDYNRLCTFCHYVDDKISWLILVSFMNNFYFIIFQVNASLTLVMATPLEIVYYFISMSLLILRVVCICLYASRVHEESKLPMDLLSCTPFDDYNSEMIKLIESCKYQTVGITGKRIFLITKCTILKITEGVLAYELVVIQFNKKLPRKEQPSLYSMC